MTVSIDEIESLVARIMRAYQLTKADFDVTEQAADCCRRIREKPNAIVQAELDALKHRLQARASIARMYAPQESLDDRAHKAAVERRTAFWRERERGFSPAAASKRAAEKLGVSPKTIMRAVNGY